MFACIFEPHTHSCGLQSLDFMITASPDPGSKYNVEDEKQYQRQSLSFSFRVKTSYRLTYNIRGSQKQLCQTHTYEVDNALIIINYCGRLIEIKLSCLPEWPKVNI